jgi:hypothetical protein
MGLSIVGPQAKPEAEKTFASMDEQTEYERAVAKGLDMSEEARMQRAKEQGYEDDVFYKGAYPYDTDTGKEIESIDRPSLFPTFDPNDPEGVKIAGFLTKDTAVSDRFSGLITQTGASYPLKYKMGRVKEIDGSNQKAGDVQFGESGKGFRDAIRSGEYDTIVIKNTKDEGDIYVALKASNIRSVNAAFDPDYKSSPRLLAQSAGTQVAKGQDFGDIEITYTEQDAAGNTVEITEKAQDVWDDNQDRLETIARIRDCLS